jgi:hypothetical protein
MASPKRPQGKRLPHAHTETLHTHGNPPRKRDDQREWDPIFTEPKFIVILWELKPPAAWGYSQLRHGVAQCPFSIKCLFKDIRSTFKFNILFQILHFIYYKKIPFNVLLRRIYKKYFDARVFYGVGKDDISSEYFAALYI